MELGRNTFTNTTTTTTTKKREPAKFVERREENILNGRFQLGGAVARCGDSESSRVESLSIEA